MQLIIFSNVQQEFQNIQTLKFIYLQRIILKYSDLVCNKNLEAHVQ